MAATIFMLALHHDVLYSHAELPTVPLSVITATFCDSHHTHRWAHSLLHSYIKIYEAVKGRGLNKLVSYSKKPTDVGGK